MYLSEKLVFVELHKTGGTHLGKWLSRLVPGEQVGKHNRVPKELHNRFILGAVRNPWDWYVSLWGYGCDRQGSVWHQTTRGVSWSYYWHQLPGEMGHKYPSATAVARQALADFSKPVGAWRDVYGSSQDAEGFRAWLRLMFDPGRRFDMGEGYGFSPVADCAGILTYRFLKLFTSLDDKLYSSRDLSSLSNLEQIWQNNKITRYIIRNENLEEDLLVALEMAGVEVADADRQALLDARNNRTNTSSRQATEHYYDAETVALVREREKLIVDLFNYSSPAVE